MGPRADKDRPKTCVVVEDDDLLRKAMVDALATLGFAVREASSVKAALGTLAEGSPDLLLLDVALPDGRAADVLRVIETLSPTPCVVAMSGAAGPDESFELAARGVRAYLRKPINLKELEAAVGRALSEPPDLAPWVKSTVGLTPIHCIEQSVRKTMVREALARGQGNRRWAARALGISRQLLQQILRKG